MNYIPVTPRGAGAEQAEEQRPPVLWRLLLRIPGVGAGLRAAERVPWRALFGVCCGAWLSGWWWSHHPDPQLLDGLLMTAFYSVGMFAALTPRWEDPDAE